MIPQPLSLASRSRSLSALCLFAIACALTLPAHSQDVLTYHNNIARTAFDNAETTLTLTNVNSATFGKLFILPADGHVDAEPLYISSVSIAGVIHNILIVVTENDSVYAYDADTGASLWKITTLLSGEVPSDDHGCGQISPTIGITATPAITHPKKGDPVIYLVAMSKDTSGNYYQRLHALDATTGAELHGGPVTVSAQYPGTGDNSSGGFVIFEPSQYAERSGLLLTDNTVYLAWTSHCDARPYTGWVMGYNATTLAQTTVLDLTPNANEGAIWGAGAGMSSDGKGNIFLLDANGVFDSTLNASGFPSEGDYGNAFLRLTSGGALAVADYFEMYNGITESDDDTDLGSGGSLLTNQKNSAGKVVPLAIGAGKDSNLYVVNRANMGKFNSTSNHIYQELTGALPGGIWSTPAATNNSVYYGPVGSPILEFQFKNAKLLPTAVAKTSNSFAYPGASPSISANAGENTILWASENTNPAVLHAYNATTLVELYNTNQAAGGRDQFGAGNKFITPMIASGKVYVGTTTGVGVFGLLADSQKNSKK